MTQRRVGTDWEQLQEAYRQGREHGYAEVEREVTRRLNAAVASGLLGADAVQAALLEDNRRAHNGGATPPRSRGKGSAPSTAGTHPRTAAPRRPGAASSGRAVGKPKPPEATISLWNAGTLGPPMRLARD